MRFRRRLQYERGLKAVHVAPFITVAFLLLMFLLFAAGFCDLPGARIRPSGGAVAAGGQTLRIILSGGSAAVNGLPMTDPQLSSFLGAVASRDPGVLIMASKSTPIESVMRIWRLCGNAGIRRISLVTD